MKVLMVCLGNICRSPLAEGILKSKKPDWYVDSAGTSNYHIGERPDLRSIEIARKYNIDISNQRARQFSREDFAKFDLILAMDSSNYQNILKLARSEADKEKVKLILNYAQPGLNMAVPDPYYDGGFEKVYQLLNEALDNLV
ncbi:low molecular weight protein-tyrosine-phosphatase [Portibacter lacus]|uniref:protein-tyrosine-phosphatase n=1 Tax=Portibacter lacus TaxID=1099794 RepID=A0AA37WEP6_9BACT|nr:low molecular weight protein-tyrosine-phosphatase [Portibacter lacus]GLR16889.1 protein-tyrosine-phosphatase [Portibacter lacus]